jgi:hypothetical protein
MSGKHLASVLATLARNGALARIQAAFLISTVVEWAGWLALVVIAFERGGAAEAGLIGFAVGVPAIVVAPTAAILGGRRRSRPSSRSSCSRSSAKHSSRHSPASRAAA